MSLLSKYFEYNDFSWYDVKYLYQIIDIYNLNDIFVTEKKLYSLSKYEIKFYDNHVSLTLIFYYNTINKNIHILIPKRSKIIKLKPNTLIYYFYKEKITKSFIKLLHTFLDDITLNRYSSLSIFESSFYEWAREDLIKKISIDFFKKFIENYKNILLSYDIQINPYFCIRSKFDINEMKTSSILYMSIYKQYYNIIITKYGNRIFNLDIPKSIEAYDISYYILLKILEKEVICDKKI